MPMMDDDLTGFLHARLDEDEAAARSAARSAPGGSELAQQAGPCVDEAGYAHIARHDPARALREVAAGRAILARYEDCLARMEAPAYSGANEYVQIREYEDFILPNRAAVYSDHPDYRQTWKP